MDRLNSKKTFKELGKIISLDSKYRPHTFIIVLLILFLIPISFLENSPKLSICAKILKENCPSIGITRGVSSLLKGNLGLALNYNWLSIPVLIIMLSIIIYDLHKKLTKFKKETIIKIS